MEFSPGDQKIQNSTEFNQKSHGNVDILIRSLLINVCLQFAMNDLEGAFLYGLLECNLEIYFIKNIDCF